MDFIIYTFGLDEILLTYLKNSSYTNYVLRKTLMFLTSVFIRIHLGAILSYFFYVKTYSYIIDIIINLILLSCTDIIIQYIQKYELYFELFVKYLIDNYNENNIFKWKRIFNLLFCFYILILLQIITIDNRILSICIIQYMITFFIWEIIEKRKIQNYIAQKNRSINPKIKKSSKLDIIDDTFSTGINDIKNETNENINNSNFIKNSIGNEIEIDYNFFSR